MLNMARKKIAPSVNLLSPGKRALAAILDVVFDVAIMALLYGVIGAPVILANNGFKEETLARTAYIQAPEIAVENNGKYSYYVYDAYNAETKQYGYELYLNKTWNYFTTFLLTHDDYDFNPGGFGKTQGKSFLSFEGDRHDAAQVGKWAYENFIQCDYFVPAKDGQGNPDYTKTPQLSDSAKAVGEDGILLLAKDLRGFFYNYTLNETGAYVEAALHLIKQPRIAQYDHSITMKQYFAYFPFVLGVPLIMQFLLPLLLPNGRTLGKLCVQGGILNEDGFTASKGQIALRCIIPTAVWFFLCIPLIYVGVMAFLFSCAILYMFIVMSRNQQGLADRLAATIVINTRTSIWFRSRADMEDYIAGHPNSLVARLNNPDGKNSHPKTKEDYGVFDASMIGEARRKAETIDSFDEFEATEEKPIEPPKFEPRVEEPKAEEAAEVPEEEGSSLEEEEAIFTDETPKDKKK